MLERLRQEYDDSSYKQDNKALILSPTENEIEYSYGLLEDIYDYINNKFGLPLEEEWV